MRIAIPLSRQDFRAAIPTQITLLLSEGAALAHVLVSITDVGERFGALRREAV